MTLTTDEVRQHIDTPLDDEALQLLIDGLAAEIVRFAGALGAVTDLAGGGGRFITLARPAASITSITETVHTTVTTLSADDYLIHPGGYVIERLNTGTNPRWRWWGRVTVASTSVDDEAIRDIVLLDLLRLALNFNPGVSMEQIGQWMEQKSANSVWNQSTERLSILSRLSPEPSLIVVGG